MREGGCRCSAGAFWGVSWLGSVSSVGGDGELGSKSVFSMAHEGNASTQQEHIGVKMLIFLMHGEHGIFNEYLVVRGKKSQRDASETAQTNNPVLLLFVQSDRGVVHLFLCFFLRTILFCHVAEDLCSHKPSARFSEINPL